MIENSSNSAEAAEISATNFNIQSNERTIQRWCRLGRLQSIKPGKSRYMTKQQLISALKQEEIV